MNHEQKHHPTNELAFFIDGMSCGGCAASLEQRIRNIANVDYASINFATSAAIVHFCESEKEEKLFQRVHKKIAPLGYTLRERHRIENQQTHERLRQLRIRLAVATLFGMWTMMLSLVAFFSEGSDMGNREYFYLSIASGVMALPVIFYAGEHFYKMAWRNLRGGMWGIDNLISLGVISATVLSLVQIVRGEGHVYFDAAVMLITLQLAARLIEFNLKQSASQQLDALLESPPETVQKIIKDQVSRVAIETVQEGDQVFVAGGEKLYFDGELISRTAFVDNQYLTGETRPAELYAGDKVFAGTVNTGAALTMRITALTGERRIDAIKDNIWRTLAEKPRIQKITDRIAMWSAPLVLIVAALALLGHALWGAGIADAVEIWLATIVIGCPCALSLAIPLAVGFATQTAGKQGLIVQDSMALERAGDIRTLCFDKTGTLTNTQLRLSSVKTHPAYTSDAIVKLASSLQQGIDHPLAGALRKKAAPVPLRNAATVHAGCGVEYTMQVGENFAPGHYHIGSRRWLKSEGINIPQTSNREAMPETHLAKDGVWLASLYFDMTLRPEATEVISELRSMSVTPLLVSGDLQAVCKATAQRVGIAPENIFAELSPEQKRAIVLTHEQNAEHIAFIGDGLNDGLALSAAGLGIAAPNAISLAKQSAGVIISDSGLKPVLRLLALGKKTRTVLRQNLAFSLLYNALALPLAASGIIDPRIGIIAMSASALSVLFNASRLIQKADKPHAYQHTIGATT